MSWLLNGVPQSDTGFVTGDPPISYPRNWIATASPSERAAVGITAAPVPKPFDSTFFDGWDKDGKLIEKNLADLKTYWKNLQETHANGLLNDSDWMVVREAEGGASCHSAWKTYRGQVRVQCNTRQTKIGETTTTTKLQQLITAPDKVIKNTLTGEMMTNPDPFLPLWPTPPTC